MEISNDKQGVAAIYARISKKDQKHPERDQSIENQIHLAREYIGKDSELCHMEIQIFRDEGYTGTNLNRPSVRKLLAGIYLGKIQALVVKDFSRLSRNHIQMSEFREDTFLRYPIVFISIGDQYDSRRRDTVELCAGFRSIFYEYYCRDVSRKVKHALEARKQSGEYAVAKAPYGYRKSESGRFEICPEEAAQIREIFKLAVQGKNTVQIARWMNLLEEAPNSWGDAGMEETHHVRWQPAGIWRILNNPVYVGTHIWHKYESVYRDGFCRRNVERAQWNRQEESHPAIISQEEFLRAGQLQKRTEGYGKKKGKRHIFHGITRCGYCQRALCGHRQKKEWLVCREKHQGKQNAILWMKLWKICAWLWFDGEPPQMQEWEMELFLHQFIERITVGPGQQIWIQWRVTDQKEV